MTRNFTFSQYRKTFGCRNDYQFSIFTVGFETEASDSQMCVTFCIVLTLKQYLKKQILAC